MNMMVRRACKVARMLGINLNYVFDFRTAWERRQSFFFRYHQRPPRRARRPADDLNEAQKREEGLSA